ncbi:MAG TPA: hypothetical protein VK187_12600 [Geobacteraceae bacterium]|nr:hypothetical protein [Geobacteraceae bacterium]
MSRRRTVAGPRAAKKRDAVRNRVVPVLAVLLWIGASGAARGAETIADPSAGKDALPPKEVRASCNTIAAILTVYPTFVVETSEGLVQGVRDGPERVGCRVRAAGPAWGLVGEVPPDLALRDLMGQLGWKEDLRHAADGPGTTSFALRKERVLCIVGGGAPSGIDDGKVVRAETYELDAGCAANPDP